MSAPESRVRIIQLLCPSRHCVIGCAYQSPDGAPDASYTEKMLESYRRISAGDDTCGLCGSRDLKTEDSPTQWHTLEEAQPALRQAETDQLKARAVHDSLSSKAGRKAPGMN